MGIGEYFEYLKTGRFDDEPKPASKVCVFTGSIEECREFVRANRFNCLLTGMEIRDSKVHAYRTDQQASR